MPRFLDQERSLLVTTNMKVLYSSLCRQADLHPIGEARMVREILLGGRHRHLMFVRHPHDRLVSAYVDKFQTHPRWLGTPRFEGWQKIQHRYLKELGVDVDAGDEFIKDALLKVDFGTFIERLPRLFMRDAHLRPQHHRMSLAIRMRVRVAPLRIDELIRIEEIDHRRIRDDLGIELDTIRENATTHGPSSEYFTPRLREVVDRIYAKDFDLLGYPRSASPGG
jgi:hypothetical protein